MKCDNCGFECPDSYSFCSNCGADLRNMNKEAAADALEKAADTASAKRVTGTEVSDIEAAQKVFPEAVQLGYQGVYGTAEQPAQPVQQPQPRQYSQPQYGQPPRQQYSQTQQPYQMPYGYQQTCYPYGGVSPSLSPIQQALISMAKAPVFLASVILSTFSLVLNVFASIDNIKAVSYTKGFSSVSAIGLATPSFIFSLLTIIGLWIIYTGGSGGNLSNIKSGLKLIKPIIIIYTVLLSIVCGAIIILGIILMFYSTISYQPMYSYSPYGSGEIVGLSVAGSLFIIIIGIIFLALFIIVCRSVCKSINAAVSIAMGANPAPVGKAAAVLCLIVGAFDFMAGMLLLFMILAEPGYVSIYLIPIIYVTISAVENILFGVQMLKFASCVNFYRISSLYSYPGCGMN